MPDIYETLLNDEANWFSVARPNGQDGWTDPNADIFLDEQDRGDGLRPLISKVGNSASSDPVVAALRALFDNFNPFEGEDDVQLSDAAHSTEVENLLTALMNTPAMQQAAAYLQSEDSNQFPDAQAVRDWTRKVWFEPFVNEYSAPEKDCSGFEHIFVGEVQQNARPGDNKMDIGGYHSWVKYYHDQQANLVEYRGHDYPARVAKDGKDSMREASVIMTWNVNGVVYLKNPGGFFVGDRPELQFALGIIGVFDALRESFGGSGESNKATDRRVSFGQSAIDLVVYPQTVRNGNGRGTGPHLRSMYPKFRGPGAARGGSPQTLVIPHTPQNNGPLRIVRALPNPAGTDETGEWVEILNVTDHDISLEGWQLRDAQNRALALQGSLEAGKGTRVDIDRTKANSIQLGNKNGWIFLYQNDQRVAAVSYGDAKNEGIISFA